MLAAMSGPDVDFWQAHFDDGHTPWDRGASNPQLARWMAGDELSPCRIAVPGCGSGYEVVSLAQSGFDVTAIDYAPAAIARTRAALDAADVRATVIEADVLAWSPSESFEVVYEQTCLCALHPDHWVAYSRQLRAWLRPGGRLFALFMQAARPGAGDGVVAGPAYHCDINAMRALFDASRWAWPKPPYVRVSHPTGFFEIATILARV